MLYDNGGEELAKLLEHMNTAHPTIKFTYEFSRESVNFQDIRIIKGEGGEIITDLYTKPTDAHAYLYFTSCHPPHTGRSLPYSQALRICKICSNADTRQLRLDKMKKYFLDRKFPEKLVQTCITNTLQRYWDSICRPNNKFPVNANDTDIKKNKNTTVSKHFNSNNHTPKDVKVSALTRTSKDLNVRLRHEEAVIFLMGTAAPSGLNVMT